MTLADGTYVMGPQSGRLVVKTRRTGLGSRAGHDLTIEVTRWHAEVVVNTGEPERSSVDVEVEVESMEVREGSGGVKSLTDSDRADIKRNIREKVLDTAKHPTIGFHSSRIDATPDSVTVTGDLTITGTTRPVTVRGMVDDGGRVQAGATVQQSRWGIKPYSAFFGALKLADDVSVELDATLEPAG